MNGSETEPMVEFKELLGLLRLVGITIECVATPHDPQSKGESENS